MIGQVFIGDNLIGEVNFKIIDESMGVMGGNMIPNINYEKYQPIIQEHYE